MTLLGCATSAENRVKRYFHIKRRGAATADAIRFAILQMIPIGSSAERVYACLDEVGIGKDGYSVYDRAIEHPLMEGKKVICCNITYAGRPWRFVYRNYAIDFVLNDEGQLIDVDVGEGLSGP